ncbi:unnamed protein product, partial [Prorocentrum cordatum]
VHADADPQSSDVDWIERQIDWDLVEQAKYKDSGPNLDAGWCAARPPEDFQAQSNHGHFISRSMAPPPPEAELAYPRGPVTQSWLCRSGFIGNWEEVPRGSECARKCFPKAEREGQKALLHWDWWSGAGIDRCAE